MPKRKKRKPILKQERKTRTGKQQRYAEMKAYMRKVKK